MFSMIPPSGMPSGHPSNLVNEALGGDRRDQSVRYAHFVADRQRCGDCLGVNSPGTVVISIWLPSASITFRLLRSYVVWPSTLDFAGGDVQVLFGRGYPPFGGPLVDR